MATVVTESCFICQRRLPKPSERRTLGSSSKAVSFLGQFGGVPNSTIRNELTYVCKPCLNKLENGCSVCLGLQDMLSKCRQHFHLSSVTTKFVPAEEVTESSASSTEDLDCELIL